jgi:hypothetical protein
MSNAIMKKDSNMGTHNSFYCAYNHMWLHLKCNINWLLMTLKSTYISMGNFSNCNFLLWLSLKLHGSYRQRALPIAITTWKYDNVYIFFASRKVYFIILKSFVKSSKVGTRLTDLVQKLVSTLIFNFCVTKNAHMKLHVSSRSFNWRFYVFKPL